MLRRKSIAELRTAIATSRRLQASSQTALAQSMGLHQATLSRILRGRFRRCSPAVLKVCKYANISCMTDSPPGAMERSLQRLSSLARGRTANERHALKLIRLAAELLESREPAPPRRLRRAS